ncbi:tetraacyldisaccharide 4'-kinase, partial [Thalassospira xiamenensis]
RQRAAALNADLVTTEKDLMRLPVVARNGISTLGIKLEFEAPDQLEKIIKAVLSDG